MKYRLLRPVNAACTCILTAVYGLSASMVLTPGETTNVNIAVDTVLSESVSVDDRTVIMKSGAGKWTLPTGKFTQDKTVLLGVREGTVAVRKTAQELASYPRPAEIMDKAAFWLESRTNLVKDGDDIRVWRDVRDTDAGATNHYYAVADNTLTNLCPREMEIDGCTSVYFGGYQSGCWMNWLKPDGSQAVVEEIHHAFLVHGASNAWGYALGQRKGRLPCFQPPNPGRVNAKIWIGHNAENEPLLSSRTRYDGTEVDGTTKAMESGVHVIEVERLGNALFAQCFFNDRDMWKTEAGTNPFGAATAGGKRAGGEHICEMLLFTNRLSETERQAVSNWLLAKWKDAVPPASPRFSLTLATNTVVELDDATPALDQVEGDGVYLKKGASDYVISSRFQPDPHTMHVEIDGGTLTLGRTLPILCAAGDNISSTVTYAGMKLSVSDTAGAGRLVKTGDGPLLLDRLPEGVTNLSVTAGQLTLASPDRKADLLAGPDADIGAAIPEWDFEGYSAPDSNGWRRVVNNNDEYLGWHAVVPSDGGTSSVFFFDNTYGGGPGAWNMNTDTPNGHTCLAIKCDASAWCSFTVPVTGKYVLGFWAAPRSRSTMGRHLDVMIGTDADNLTSLGIFSVGIYDWTRFSFDPVLLEAGTTYQLWFRTLGLGKDYCTLFDAITLEIPEIEVGRWTVPNGDFELHAVNFVTGFSLDNTNAVLNFSVGQCTNVGTVTDTNETSGERAYTTFSTAKAPYTYYNFPWSKGGATQLYMTGEGSTVTTTFTPPAGKWRLQADLCTWAVTANSAGKSYGVAASVDIGGETVPLGQVTASDHRLTAYTWPDAFAADGETPVTLTLTGMLEDPKCGHGILDNLVLVADRPYGKNLLAGSGFNEPDEWTKVTTPKPSGCTPSRFINWDDVNFLDHFGLAPFEGEKCFMLVNDDILYQSVRFTDVGLYRLTVNLKSRGTSAPSANFGYNPVDVYVAKEGVTNWVGRSGTAATTNFNEYAFTFLIPPEGGDYDVGFRGVSVWNGDENTRVDRTTMLDAAWLCRVETEKQLELPGHMRIDIAEGARLRLDFEGTNVVDSFGIGGRRYSGCISLATHPELYPALSGPGTLYVIPDGLLILLR